MPTEPEFEHDPPRLRMSLLTQLVLLVGFLSLGPLVVTNLVGYVKSRDDMQSLASRALQGSASVASMQTRAFIEQRRDLIPALVAGNEHLHYSVTTALDTLEQSSSGDRGRALHQHLASKAGQTEDAEEFYVLSNGGAVLGSSDPDVAFGAPRASDPCLGGTPAGETRMTFDRHSPTFVVGVPIPGSRGGQLGTFCGRFRIDAGRQFAELATSPLSDVRFLIVTEEGRTVSSSSKRHIWGTQLPDLVLHRVKMGVPWSGRYNASSLSASTSALTPGEERLVAIDPLADTGWVIAAELPEAETMAPLYALRAPVAWMGVGFLLFVIVGIGFMVRTIALPLEELVGATGAMKDGRLAQRVEARGPREVAELARVFNAMSRRVSNLHDTLEERVDERTVQLEARTEELRRNQAFLDLLFDALEQHLIVVDQSRTVVKSNAAARRTYGEIIGEPYHDCCGSGDEGCADCPVAQVFATGRSISTVRAYSGTGRSEIMSVEAFPLPAEEETTTRVLIVSRQITEEKSQEAQMVHHEKMSAFALLSAGVAHEIGNPLASIKAQLRLASQREDPDFTTATLDVIDGEVDRISRLLRQIVNFARRRSGHQTLVSWNQVVDDATRLLQHDPRARRVEITTDLAADLPPVRADEDQMLQILLNIGLNGIDAIDGRGSLQVETSAEGGEVCLRVIDSGPGVTPRMRDRIFEPYVTTKSADKGTGLGLFVSRRLVEELGGSIDCEDRSGGASFIVRLPIADMNDDPHRAA